MNVRVVTFLLGSLFAATASAQTKEVARDGFSCDASRLADLPRDVAAAVARDTCDALARLSGRTGSFTVTGQRDEDRYALLLRNEDKGASVLLLVDEPADVQKSVVAGAVRWAKAREGVVPERARQFTFSLVSMVPLGLPRATPTLGGSVGYRLATPRWALGAVAELSLAGATEGGGDNGYLHGSLAFSARYFLSTGDSAAFVGGGAGLLGISEGWYTSQDRGCDALCVDFVGGDASRSLGTFAPFAEAGFVLGRTRQGQVALSLRADVPLVKMDGWTGPATTAVPGNSEEHRPAAYVVPLSLRLGFQLLADGERTRRDCSANPRARGRRFGTVCPWRSGGGRTDVTTGSGCAAISHAFSMAHRSQRSARAPRPVARPAPRFSGPRVRNRRGRRSRACTNGALGSGADEEERRHALERVAGSRRAADFTPRGDAMVTARSFVALSAALLASLPALASAQTPAPVPEPTPFSCDATRLADLPRDVAEGMARDACDALSQVSGKDGHFSVSGKREGDHYALLLRREEGDELATVLVDGPADVAKGVRSGAVRWTKRRPGVVPEQERQLTFSMVTMMPVGVATAVALGGSVAYRLATPRWAAGAVAEVTAARGSGSRGDSYLHGSFAFSARLFLSRADSAGFVGGGIGLLGVSQRWTTSAAKGCEGPFCFDPIGGDATRTLGTMAPFVEAGYVAWRSHAAQLALSVRVDVPLQRLDGWEGAPRAGAPASTTREERPAEYLLPVSLRLGMQL